MCGIVGSIRFQQVRADRQVVEEMTGVLRHRGPDDEGCWIDGPVGFGHRRLSIIDVGGSRQPMQSHDGRWTIVFNGEIFNYRELRRSLRYQFQTDGDTETILAGLATHGITYVNRLVGQFAFAAYDRAEGVIHLVRDRLGVLPLYHRTTSTGMLFASEIKAILAGMDSGPSVDYESLDSYLSGRSVAAPHTMFEGIKKLPAAHRMEVHLDGSVHEHRYWAPPVPDGSSWTPESAIDAVDDAITDAVEAALVADVPVGAYLSGGVDSSLIVAKAARHRTGEPLKTFSAGFGDPRSDELPFALAVSRHVGTEHHEVHVDATDFEDLWPVLTWHRDAPMSEPADFAVYRLAEAAREHVTVVLSGEGGDELFAGYPKYKVARAMRMLSLPPRNLRRAVGDSLDRRLPERLAKARIGLRVWAAPAPADQYRAWFSPFSRAERGALLADVSTRAVTPAESSGGDPIRAMLLSDLAGWLPDNLLERGDRMSMAASLELRPPLLDHRLVDLAFRLPSGLKVRRGATKWVLKEVARRYVPDEIVDRRKVGFRVPLDAWFRTSLRESVRERLMGDGFISQTLDRSAVADVVARHESGVFNEDIRIWTLMSLAVWHETFFGSRPSGSGSAACA